MTNEIELFLQYLQTQGRRKSTASNYRLYLSRFVETVGDKPVEDITPDDVAVFQNAINELPFETTTKSYHSVALRSFFVYLVRMGKKVISPHVVQLPKYSRKESSYLTDEELEKLLKAPKDLRDKTILHVLVSTGMRVSELCDTKIEDLNMKEKEIKVYGKGGKNRVVFLTDTAHELLTHWLKSRKHKTDYLFYPQALPNMRISSRSIQRLVEKYTKLAGLTKDCHPHTLRHSLASSLLRKGVDLRYVQKILGHGSIATTQIYTHTTDAELHKNFDSAQMNKESELEEINKKIASLIEMQTKIMNQLQKLK